MHKFARDTNSAQAGHLPLTAKQISEAAVSATRFLARWPTPGLAEHLRIPQAALLLISSAAT